MANLNRATFIGRLVKDPEIKRLKQGSIVANMSLATTRTFKDKNGERQKIPFFIDMVAWNKQAEIAEKYMSKGQELYCEGHLELDQWESEDECSKCREIKIIPRQKIRLVVSKMECTREIKKDLDAEPDRNKHSRDSGRDRDYYEDPYYRRSR